MQKWIAALNIKLKRDLSLNSHYIIIDVQGIS